MRSTRSMEEAYQALANPKPRPAHIDEGAVIDERSGLPAGVGRLYAMINPAWPGMVKIGSAGNLIKRLATYQTGTPYRDYEMIAFSVVFQDVLQAERDLHSTLAEHRVEYTEWFRISRAVAVAAVGTALNAADADPFVGMTLGGDPGDWED
jgi:hypothetical protein